MTSVWADRTNSTIGRENTGKPAGKRGARARAAPPNQKLAGEMCTERALKTPPDGVAAAWERQAYQARL